MVYPAYVYDNVSGRWTGYIVPPYSTWYVFAVLHDDEFTFQMGGYYWYHSGCCDWHYYYVSYLTAGA